MRLDQSAAAGDGRNHARQLDRRDGDGALANGDGNRFARVPFVVIDALDPFFRGHQARLFAGQINACAHAQAQAGSVVSDLVDAEHFADVVEEDVAGIDDGSVQIHSP